MSGHRTVLPYAPTKFVALIAALVAVFAPYRYITGAPEDAFSVVFVGFLYIWLAAWAGRELHDDKRTELESEDDQLSGK